MQEGNDRMRLFKSYWIICLQLSLDICLQMIYRTTQIETSSGWFVQDIRDCECCSTNLPRGVAAAHLHLLFSPHFRVQQCDPFQSSADADHKPCSRTNIGDTVL